MRGAKAFENVISRWWSFSGRTLVPGFLLMAALLLFNVTSPRAADLFPQIPKAVMGEACVEPVDDMRRNHMKYLNHHRDETVREGIRTKQHSLKNCFTCHQVQDEGGQTVSVEDPRHFCRACHDFTAVSVDCFSCHTSLPEGNGLKQAAQ